MKILKPKSLLFVCGSRSTISRAAKGDNHRAVALKNLCTTRDQFQLEKGARGKKWKSIGLLD